VENKLAGFEFRAFAPIGISARHLPARALQWQAGHSRSGEAGGLELWNDGAVGEFFFFTLFRTRV